MDTSLDLSLDLSSADIVAALRDKKGLTAGEFVIVGSAVLTLHGLRVAGDIDLVVTPALYARLRARSGWTEELFSTPVRPAALFSGPFDAGTDWSVGAYSPDPARLIAEAEFVLGVPCVPLAAVAAWKRAAGARRIWSTPRSSRVPDAR